jgi:hypothetical protein
LEIIEMTTDYLAECESDAKEMVNHFMEQIVEQLIETGEASSDYNNDYLRGDEYHHESHVDKEYDLTEAAQILDDLSDHEETDSGLWEGLEPRKAISCQAAFTYGNAVSAAWNDLIETINSDDNIEKAVELHNELSEDAIASQYLVQIVEKLVRKVIE